MPESSQLPAPGRSVTPLYALIPCTSTKWNQCPFLPAPARGGGAGEPGAGQVLGESGLRNVSQEYQRQYLNEPQ